MINTIQDTVARLVSDDGKLYLDSLELRYRGFSAYLHLDAFVLVNGTMQRVERKGREAGLLAEAILAEANKA